MYLHLSFHNGLQKVEGSFWNTLYFLIILINTKVQFFSFVGCGCLLILV